MKEQHIILLKELRRFFLFLFLLSGGVSTFGQLTYISGIVNKSSPVIEVYERRSGSNVNAVKVAEPDSFSIGDVVILYAPRGWHVDPVDGDAYLGIPHPNAAAYSINKIDSILLPEGIIVFVAPTPFHAPLLAGEMAQLIHVPDFKNEVVVNGTLRAQDWSESRGEGGVIALFVQGKLRLEANIDASGAGFEGADPSSDEYGGGCYQDNTGLYGSGYYQTTDMNEAGLKGEGAFVTTFNDSLRGMLPAFNGGGGGNAEFSGGGGGSNYSVGGQGGGQSDGNCTTTNLTRGKGGLGLSTVYYSNILPKNRIYFGGGGGSSTQTSLIGASAGGDGGGIVIIIADTIESTNGSSILANGESVNSVAMAGGSGGGGGGCIVLDVPYIKGNVNLNARGGKGGNTNNVFYTGPGGGGGGGLYWLSIPADTSSLTTNVLNSEGGVWLNGIGTNGTPGAAAERLYNLKAPLNGFLFNSLPNDLTVCTDETPDTLFASMPRGGSGVYVYRWDYKHPSAGVWNIGDTITQRYYTFHAPLTEDLQLRRIVIDTINDISEGFDVSTTYTVLPRIRGNTISAPDIICYGLEAGTLGQLGDSVLRGAHIGLPGLDTSFRWIKRPIASSDWTLISDSTKNNFTPSGDIVSTYYSRIVYSGVCDDTSNAVEITVLPEIKNNIVSESDIFCLNGAPPATLTGAMPENGDPAMYRYEWLSSSTVDGTYSIISAADTVREYTPPVPTSSGTTYYKRAYLLRTDDACLNTSNPVSIQVLEAISGNSITTPDLLLCQDSLLNNGIAGSNVAGGDGTYTFKWQTSPNETVWITRDNAAVNQALDIPSYSQTTYVRRIVISGEDSVCVDVSPTRTITVMPKITNNLIDNSTVIVCENEAFNLELTGSAAAGGNGAGTYNYQWISSQDGSSWSQLSDINSQNYTIPVLGETTFFRRIVWSAKNPDVLTATCVDTSSAVFVYEVPDSIENNIIYNDVPYDELCLGELLDISGTTPEKGYSPGSYHYRWYFGPSVNDLNDSIDGDELASYTDIPISNETVFRRLVYDDHCRSLSDTVRIHVRQLPTAILSLNTGQSDVICEDSVFLKVEITNGEDHAYHDISIDFSSAVNSGTIVKRRSTDTFILSDYPETDDSTTYSYSLIEVKDDWNCIADNLSGSPIIKVYQKPEPLILSEVLTVCGESIEIQGSSRNGATGALWKEEDPLSDLVSFADDTMMNTTMYLNNSDGYDVTTVQLVWQLTTEAGCDGMAEKTFTFYEEPMITELLVDTFEFYMQESYDLAEFQPELDAGSGEWTADNSGVELEGESLAKNFTYEAEHMFTWTVSNGDCPVKVDDMVLIQHDLRQYDAFSPDNDAYNQVFVIPGLEHADDFTFTIFNSWGTKIGEMLMANAEKKTVEIDGVNKDEYVLWDGTLGNSGEVAPEGTYYYSLQFSIGRLKDEVKKGYIILRR